ncbi:MAG TPA: YfiR family protein [Sedimentisphaerales bacterium]|nr:YfiR family protein [Sedimentisphaerales bacterium]
MAKCGYMQIANRWILLAAVMVFVPSLAVRSGYAGEAPTLEYRVKAAFLYNFLKFVEWPDDQSADANVPITIGILGEDRFGTAFDEIVSRKVKDRNIVVKRFSSHDTEQAKAGLAGCHLVFVTVSHRRHARDVAAMLAGKPVLLVGESDGFLEAGGSVNFIMQGDRVSFDINLDNADRAGLTIASQLLRLARRVVKDGRTRSSNTIDLFFRQTRGV